MAPELKEKLVSAVLEYHISSLKRTLSAKGYYIGKTLEDVERFFNHVVPDVCYCLDIDKSYDGLFVKFSQQALRNIMLHNITRVSIWKSYFIKNEEKKKEIIQAIIVDMRTYHFLDGMNFYYSSATEALLRLLYL